MFKRISKAVSSLFSALFRPQWKSYKSLVAVGLCLSFITIAALAAMDTGSGLGYGEPALTEHDALVKYAEKTQFEVDTEDDMTIPYNNSLPSLFLVIPLYSKLNTSDIISNNSREGILTLIASQPGITLGAITRKLKLKTGTAAHHIRILEREGYIKSKKTGKFRRYYCLGVKASGLNELQDRLVAKIQNMPGITQSELGRELELSRQLVNYHIQDLEEQQVIRLERQGNKSLCFSLT
jgi:DNA-binding MarR family transcriptional regulator